MATSVGFIGVGNMGNPMAANVLKAGFPMTVFDTSAKAMDNLVQAGARLDQARRGGQHAAQIDQQRSAPGALHQPTGTEVHGLHVGRGGE